MLEIYELDVVDSLSAQTAITNEFCDQGTRAPQVDIDPVTERLFVRATSEQHGRIHQLLVKMGEMKLFVLGGRSTQAMRSIHFPGDVQQAIEQIQRVWPKLRENEMRVVAPGTTLPPPAGRSGKSEAQQATTPPPASPEESPQATEREDTNEPDQDGPNDRGDNQAAASGTFRPRRGESWLMFAAFQLNQPAEEHQPGPRRPKSPNRQRPRRPSPLPKHRRPRQAAASRKEGGAGRGSPWRGPTAQSSASYIIPGKDSVTIVSDDPEAWSSWKICSAPFHCSRAT